jgi:superfamily II DNA/RNA helicase
VYKHRSGRTARAGSTGTVVCLVLKSQIRKYKRIQNEVGIKCRFVDPNLDRLEGREFVEAPPLKYDDDDKKPRGRRKSRNNKRSRRYKKSDGYKSQKSDDKKAGGRQKKKSYRHRNKRKSKKKVTYKDKRNNKAKFNRR